MLRGVKNYSPEEQIQREKIVSIIRSVLKKYGFNPTETPILNQYSLLSSKYGGGDEILNECYRLKDRGDRDLGLRYELTITLPQFLNENPDIKIPFKRYEIGKVFRDGPIKKGRIREFTQIDFDIVGVKNQLGEAEILSVFNEVFKKLNLKVSIKINNRKILFGILEYLNITTNQNSVLLSIDKLDKIGENNVKKELIDKGLDKEQINKLFKIFNYSFDELKKLKNAKIEEGVKEISKIIEYSELLGIDVIEVSLPLVRGLNYYTGTIYEVFLNSLKSSLGAGGRYDNLLKNLCGKDLPVVGGSFGLDAICSVINKENIRNVCEVYFIPVGISEREYLPIVKKLRDYGLKLDYDMLNRGISKNLEYADKNKISYCIIFGEKEKKEGKLKLKNMSNREEKIYNVEEVVDVIKNKQ